MNDSAPSSSDLPQPKTTRWQPLRLGLIELYHYDSEEFWFEDGHLLLRGNNGTGKSKVLSLTLPFLLDADLSPARLEPDADRGKRMEWNLLMGNRFERRTGYAWIEFGRVADDGTPECVTLGCGLRATAGRSSVDSWFFVTEARVGADLRLISEQQTALTRERLIEAVGGHAVYTTGRDYRRAIDERLFGLGAERYRALIDTLIQLRQPQLSKQPNEQNLSAALSQALPPLERTLLEDVAEAMTQLDEYRDDLNDYRAMAAAVAQFNKTYGRYAQILARRRARTLRQAQTAFDNASAAARQARDEHAAAEQAVADRRWEHETAGEQLAEVGGQIEALKDSPEMRGARELHRAQTEAEQAARDAEAAAGDQQRAATRHARERDGVARRERASAESRATLGTAMTAQAEHARDAGVSEAHAASWGEHDAPDAVAAAPAPARAAISTAQQHLAEQRARQIAQIRKRLDAVDTARNQYAQAQNERDARFADSEAAEAEVGEARTAQQAAAAAHVEAWRVFIADAAPRLGADWPDVEESLADWTRSLDGVSPLDAVLVEAERAARAAIAERRSELSAEQDAIETDLEPLRTERAELAEGRQPQPPVPFTREAEREARPGAPFWQVIDFAEETSEAERAGLEAALQAAGLLDAWVTPAGELLDPDTRDVWLIARRPAARSLGDYLRVEIDTADPQGSGLDANAVRAVLAGIALGEDESAECWVDVDGRYRIGPSRGAWAKPQADYIGFAAREAARRRRMAALTAEIEALEARLQAIDAERERLGREREALDALLAGRPDAGALRDAHATLAAAERSAARARERLAEAETGLQRARTALERAQEELDWDAQDARLPAERAALETVAGHLADYRNAVTDTRAAIREHAQALAEAADQIAREQAARADRDTAAERARARQQRAREARARHAELKSVVGASAEDVLARLSGLQTQYKNLEQTRDTAQEQTATAREALGGARQHAEDSEARRVEREQARREAIVIVQAFAETGLLAAAVPEVILPDTAQAWTVDAALAAARGAEAALAHISDADEDWKRVQDRLGAEFTELQRAMSARGYASSGEPGDHGFIVRVEFNQRHEAPHRLQSLLEAEIAERASLLTAKEREIIENHLQAEVAARLQELMREADERVRRINAELDARPTSTGVKFKLVWQPREGADDAGLSGLADVRKRLLNKISDAWSADDRAAVGAFLQQRIDAERDRDDGAARIDQLARALDYRAWHQFRVRRWQDGQWRGLSGPASSGERALGLTVPLFAAASSHYESASEKAPRLVLLDEAFAGIDDAARAHCMDLIREFDLDFVMTSEREWGCYAELPGVSICHLVRRADVDAVFVSRWRWNGRAREAAPEPRRASRFVEADAGTA